uniref:Derlin n=2 Tax=Babesia bovis TaxID=5865 RepID=A7APU9_BABBO|eukprot:XP_001612151.1 hypothetical protein [Babesia bovis T2Bo]
MINILTYIWGRKNPYNRVGIIFLNVPAPYLPWVMLALSHFSGSSLTENIMGIFVGHTYYYFTEVFPTMPITHGIRPLDTPGFL